jgi:dTDP-4-dehydrorhamnose reductase
VSQRIIITGAGGQVGRLLAERAAQQGRTMLAMTSAQWDITDAAAAPPLHDGDVVVNCAAFTNVDAAEENQAAAFAVNATGAGNVAGACARAGARLVHISTDYVFSGDFGAEPPRPYEPDDPTEPVSSYGRSKLAGEHAVHAALPSATVVRTAWVYTGGDGNDFVAVMARKARSGATVNVVDDQTGAPTYARDLVTALLQIADNGVSAPVVHAANAGQASRFDQARAVYAALGVDEDLVRPVATEAYPRPAARPSYSALGSRLSTAAGLAPLRTWEEALTAALSSR